MDVLSVSEPRDAAMLVEAVASVGAARGRALWEAKSGLPSCRSKRQTESRVVFVHVFKAAGSTIRELLRSYSRACQRRWACLIGCDKKDMIKGRDVSCTMKDVINSPSIQRSRNRDIVVSKRNPTVEEVLKFDIVGGHVSPGINLAYPASMRVHFVTLVREPMASAVSGVRYQNPTWKLPSVVEYIVQRLEKGRELSGTAANYVSATGNVEDAKRNVATLFDVVGLVENWNVSIKLLQLFIDPGLGWKSWFKSKTKNKSRGTFSTIDVLDQLPPETFLHLKNSTAKAFELYQVAVEAHANTCATILAGATDVRALACDCAVREATPMSPRFVECADVVEKTSKKHRDNDRSDHIKASPIEDILDTSNASNYDGIAKAAATPF